MGFICRQAPLANSKKSEHASTLRSMSESSIPFWALSWARAGTEARSRQSRDLTGRIWLSSKKESRFRNSYGRRGPKFGARHKIPAAR